MIRFAVLLLLLVPVDGLAQGGSFDFEQGLTGWRAEGAAFEGQPLLAEDLTTDAVSPVALGGDYWRGLPFPIGHQGAYFLRSADALRGRLVSDEFTLGAADRYFSALLGGTNDPLVAMELQVRDANVPGATIRDGFSVVFRATSKGHESLERVVFRIPPALTGRRARVLILDDSERAHLNADDIRLSVEPPPRSTPPVWGLGDFHTHPMTHIAFGAFNGVRALWGVPGRSASEYDGSPWLVTRDIPPCEPRHRGGGSAEVFVNSAEGRLASRGVLDGLWSLLTGRATRHRRDGGPAFGAFPSFTGGAHQQMHVTQIHRAWRGGLRLMVAIAVHNIGVEFLTARPQQGVVYLSREREVLEAQVCGMRQLAALNSAWMEIAYSHLQAQDIIARGRLAVVLGVEMDQLGALGVGPPKKEVAYLWRLGIRQVTPIHAVDNSLGGAAVFQPVYNSLNDLVHRGVINLRASDRDRYPPKFFEVTEFRCGSAEPPAGECTEFAFEEKPQRAVLTRSPLAWFKLTPFVASERSNPYRDKIGIVNRRGLEPAGRQYLRALMDQGMLVGLEHMSRESVEDVYEVLASRLLEAGHAECAGFGRAEVPASCDAAAYPLSVSHAHFRRLSLPRAATTVASYRASEYEVSDRQAGMIARTGGVIGQFVAEDPVTPPGQLPFRNDCAGSSKSFAASLSYGLSLLKGTGLGIATDFTFIPGTSPRFGDSACWARAAAKDPDEERRLLPVQYDLSGQDNGVRYTTGIVANSVRGGANEPLEPSRLGDRTYDFNLDGFAHYGLLPDLLQDVKNIGAPREVLNALFSSAESYLRMWEKAERVSGGGATTPFVPSAVDCVSSCRGLCPQDPFAGAPH